MFGFKLGFRKEGGSYQVDRTARQKARLSSKLGRIPLDATGARVQMFRRESLERLDAYYENRQYDHLQEWDATCDSTEHVPVRKRRPRIKYSYAKILANRVAGKIVSKRSFPALTIEEDPDTQALIEAVLRSGSVQSLLMEPIRRLTVAGSVFVRFKMSGGALKVEHYLSKYCYPVFDASGDLEAMTIKWVYDDPADLDEKGSPRKKWYRLDLGKESDVLYDNPYYVPNEEPSFEVVAQADHQMGFVQGEWFRLGEDKHSPDGYSLIEDVTEFIDEFNYSISQSSNAVGYNQDPQLILAGMTEEELEGVIRSSAKAWNLGREGKATLLEGNLSGVERAVELRDKVCLHISDVTRVILMDPEKFSGHAQSGKAMETLLEPFVDLVEEIRLIIEPSLVRLITKIVIAVLKMASMGEPTPVTIPASYRVMSLNIVPTWPPVFPPTTEDLLKKVQVVVAATSANLISRETGTKYLAKDFGVQDIEEEVAKVAAQPVLNPFGSF